MISDEPQGRCGRAIPAILLFVSGTGHTAAPHLPAQDVFRRQLFHDDRRGPSGSSRLVPAQGAPSSPRLVRHPTGQPRRPRPGSAPRRWRRSRQPSPCSIRRGPSPRTGAKVSSSTSLSRPPACGGIGPDGRGVHTARTWRPSHGHVVVQATWPAIGLTYAAGAAHFALPQGFTHVPAQGAVLVELSGVARATCMDGRGRDFGARMASGTCSSSTP